MVIACASSKLLHGPRKRPGAPSNRCGRSLHSPLICPCEHRDPLIGTVFRGASLILAVDGFGFLLYALVFGGLGYAFGDQLEAIFRVTARFNRGDRELIAARRQPSAYAEAA